MDKKPFLDEARRAFEQWAEVRRLTGNPDPIIELALDQGKVLMGSPTPINIQPGLAKSCFQNAYQLVSKHPQWRYVEGYGISKHLGFPLHHAWCLTEAGEIIDNSWGDPVDTAYIGVSVNCREMFDRAVESGIYGLFVDKEHKIDVDWMEAFFKWELRGREGTYSKGAKTIFKGPCLSKF